MGRWDRRNPRYVGVVRFVPLVARDGWGTWVHRSVPRPRGTRPRGAGAPVLDLRRGVALLSCHVVPSAQANGDGGSAAGGQRGGDGPAQEEAPQAKEVRQVRLRPFVDVRDGTAKKSRPIPAYRIERLLIGYPNTDDRAGDGTRTRDIKLGRLALYQLSYSRVFRYYPLTQPAVLQW